MIVEGEANKDFLTGYYTREGLYPRMQKLQLDYQSYQTPFSILIMDLDHFKPYNDKYGHATGDEILKYFSNFIRTDLVAEQTYLFRLGGDEFVALFPAKKPDEVRRLTNRMIKNLRRAPCSVGNRQVKLSFSAGISSYPAHVDTSPELLHRADQAMYFSKRTGRGRVTQYDNFLMMRLEQVMRFLSVLVLAVFVGFGIEFGIQSYPALENKIFLGIAGKADPLVAYLKEKASHAMKSVGSSFKTEFLARRLEIPTPPFSSIQKPDGEPLNTPPMIERDLIYLKSGKVIQGIILKEDESRLTLQLNISAKKAVLMLEKSDVLKIVRKNTPEDN